MDLTKWEWMKSKKSQHMFVAAAATTGACVLGCALKMLWPAYPEDNVVEEKIEQIIEEQSGIDIDLSPCTPEGNPR